MNGRQTGTSRLNYEHETLRDALPRDLHLDDALAAAAVEVAYEVRRHVGVTRHLSPLVAGAAPQPVGQDAVDHERPHVRLRPPVGRPETLPLDELVIALFVATAAGGGTLIALFVATAARGGHS